MRAFALVSLVALAVACSPREKIIVIKEPAADPPKPAPIEPTTTTTNEPIATDSAPSDESDWGIKDPSDSREYARVIDRVTNMVSDGDLRRRVSRRNLSLVNVAWEDTGRAQGSALGPNISDLTLQVRRRDESGQFAASIMPVIRQPNFTDRTGDVPSDRFFVRVGNEKRSEGLRSVP
jgi:hypothetical protein